MGDAGHSPDSNAMIVVGVMSGTSADGIDVAIVEIKQDGIDGGGRRLRFLHHSSTEYSAPLRAAVLSSMDAKQISVAEIARLNWRLGMAYAEAVKSALLGSGISAELVGCHGQTIYHQGTAADFADRSFRCTWQLGEMSLIAYETCLPVVSNFRPADMVAGGQGAPLVPYLDYTLFRDAERNRVLQNLGGIGNLTAIPANASAAELIAFDTGPANMIIDFLMQELFDKAFDDEGLIAARGNPSAEIVADCMKDPYFALGLPKSTGREQFGASYAERLLGACRAGGLSDDNIIATATAFTVESVRSSFARFVAPILRPGETDYIVAGGGSRNKTLMRMLADALAPFGCKVTKMDSLGIPSQAKEAVAFALLAYETWHHRPSNVPAATGAKHAVILGQVTYSA